MFKKFLLILLLSTTLISCAKKYPTSNQDHISFERTKEKTSRIWFAPFIDKDGNQHEGSYINIITKSSKWKESQFPQNNLEEEMEVQEQEL